MGFFSWKTCDTNKSITNSSSDLKTFTVYMITPDGRSFKEEDYEGYGEFGGKDFYELVAELNGKSNREEGIDMCFKDNSSGDNTPNIIYPKLVEYLSKDVKSQYSTLKNPISCEYQGFFLDDECEEDYEY